MIRRLLLRLLRIKPETVIIVRLEPAVMADLRKRAGVSCVVTNLTSDHMAGYQLGVNHVLGVLQEGYVTSRT